MANLNLNPPSFATAEEIQAWQNMMETMVTFIKASTNLMNTINKKVGIVESSTAVPPQVNFSQQQQQYREPQAPYLGFGCEPECLACMPKPPCGICPANEDQKDSTKLETGATKAIISTVEKSPPTLEPIHQVDTITEEAPDESNDAEIPASDEVGGDTENTNPDNEDATAGAISGVEKLEQTTETTGSVTKQSKSTSKTNAQKSESKMQNNGLSCVCAAIRAKRMSEKQAEEERPKTKIIRDQEGVEDLCGCTPTEEESAKMVEEIQSNLVEARHELSRMEGQVEELRKIVKPSRQEKQSKALYNEIMKTGDVRRIRPGDPSSRYSQGIISGTGHPTLGPSQREIPNTFGSTRGYSSIRPASRMPPNTFGSTYDISPIGLPPPTMLPQNTFGAGISPICGPCGPPGSSGATQQDFHSLWGSTYNSQPTEGISPICGPCGPPGSSGATQQDFHSLWGSTYNSQPTEDSPYNEGNYYSPPPQQPQMTKIQRICTNRPISNISGGSANRTMSRPPPRPAPFEIYEDSSKGQQARQFVSRQPSGVNPNCPGGAVCNQPSSRYR